MPDISLTDWLALALFLAGGGLVALMVIVTQRSYRRDERTEHWVQYPTAKGEVPVVPPQPGLWALVVDDAGRKPIQVVKEIRALTRLGLVEAKQLVDHAPSTILSGVDHAAASVAYRVLATAGATVRITEVAATPEALARAAAPGDSYAVVVDHAGPKHIQVIKEIRALTGLGLAEAKRLADVTPSTILSGVDHATATAAHDRLAGAGAVVRVAEA
ncbi:ribosomal protein bL12 [Glycomyces harbinensis]|uniref:Ribosomal protein L7/L12 n=1 Tax=Glycomyces harbinensis TaxID=58114 RepID=A0A1G6YRH7_9ACTN|nr:ribosomal protein L7/L12 [Glycomyces harbinensis]SDD93104.1 ribosomal protein L7/L12 [Glycomyces harbinensis]